MKGLVKLRGYAPPTPRFPFNRFLTTPSLHFTNVVLHTPRGSGQEADSKRGVGGANEVVKKRREKKTKKRKGYFLGLGRVFLRAGVRSGRIFSRSFKSRSIENSLNCFLMILLISALFKLNCLASSAWVIFAFCRYFTNSSQI